MKLEFLQYYFGQHKDKKIVYFLGAKADGESLKNLGKTEYFEEIKVIFENKNDAEKVDISSIKNCSVVDAEEYKNSDDFTVVLDCYEKVEGIKTRKVVGSFNEKTDTYKLWQILRNSCDEIVLAKEFDEYKNEVLEWKKDPENDIELSVIFPVYNVAKYLDKCLESISKWDAPYVEYLFVNDGSPDNSAEIIQKWAKKDSRIKLLNKENGGCASARNFGLEKSKGRYVGLIDPDDFIDPTMFEKLHSRAMTGSYDIAYCGYNEFYEDSQTSKKIDDVLVPPYTTGTADEKFVSRLISDLHVAIWRGIYKKDLLIKNNISFHSELRRFDDLPFKVEVYSKATSVVCVNEHLYYYRLGRAGQDVSANDERLYVHFDIFKILDEFFKGKASSAQLKRYYQVKVQTHYWAATIIKDELKETYKEKAARDLGIENSKTNWKKILRKYYRNRDIKAFFK